MPNFIQTLIISLLHTFENQILKTPYENPKWTCMKKNNFDSPWGNYVFN